MDREPLKMPSHEGAPAKHRRVYKAVSVADGEGAFHVMIDGKPALTPMRIPLSAKARALAEAVAAEWDAQKSHIDPETMPLTRLLATESDRVAPQREEVIANLLSYVDADAICYRAPHPAELRDRQREKWQPILDWLLREQDIALLSVEGLMPAQQPPGVSLRLRQVLASLDDPALTAFQACAALTNSLALSLALVRRRISANDVFAAAFLDELFQAEKWGTDTAAQDRRDRIAADLQGIGRYLELAVA